jgi:glycosyltransferase involved in cell wall biosynthesis
MKLLFVDPADIIGGAELFTVDLVRNLNKKKFDVHLLTGENEKYRNKFPKASITFHTQKLPRLKPISPITLAKFFNTKRKLKKRIKEISPDIIITNSVRSHIVLSPLTKKLNIPLVWIIHDDTFPAWLLKRLIHIPGKVFTCSKYMKDWIVNNTRPEWESKTEVLYNGIDLKKVKQSKNNSTQKHVGLVGRLVPWKGQEFFLRVAKEILEKRNDVHFSIIGKTHQTSESQKHLKKLEKLIGKWKLQKNIEIKTNVKELVPEMQKLDLLVHASLAPEPFGRVIIEAMSLHIPIIASNLGGPKEIIDDGVDGFLVDPKDTQLLAKRIEQILDDEKLKKLFAENAYAKIEEIFNLELVVQKFERIISKL